jgi:hypothetical protein
MHTCLKSFEPYLDAHKRTEKPVLHVSINPDPKDVLSDEQLSEIAQIYMQKMGYADQPFIVYKHEDIERKHIHIVSLRVDENGKKIDHNFERRRSMDVCRELESQTEIGRLLIEDTPTPKSRDGMAALVIGLRELHKNTVYRNRILDILEAKLITGKPRTGRPGMNLWTICIGSDTSVQRVEL